MLHVEKQKVHHDSLFASGTRAHFLSNDPLVDYTTHWRLREAFHRLEAACENRVDKNSRILVMCAGEGAEASQLCNMGYNDVTVSDISDIGVATAVQRDSRLKGIVLNAQQAEIEDRAFDIVLVQDGLHHLPSPVQGFTEMLRIASKAAVFLEPHQSLVGRLIGTQWEQNGEAVNYVFRWSRELVHAVTCSYLCRDDFRNLSFSFWHRNIVYHRLGQKIGGGQFAIHVLSFVKFGLDHVLGSFGNQFCGLVIKPGV